MTHAKTHAEGNDGNVEGTKRKVETGRGSARARGRKRCCGRKQRAICLVSSEVLFDAILSDTIL